MLPSLPRLPNLVYFFKGDCLQVLGFRNFTLKITCHMYSREERTRLTGEIDYMSASISGAERYFRRSLHMKNCRDRLIISSGSPEKGGCPRIRACSVIRSNTVVHLSEI